MDDPYDLERFVRAQNAGGSYNRALDELRAGRKDSHWMWFVFPQLAGLGHSAMAIKFAISSLEEARLYLDHPVLGPRLLDCAQLVVATECRAAERIFGATDAQKLHSCITLFFRAAPTETPFAVLLDRFFAGEADPATDRLLLRAQRP